MNNLEIIQLKENLINTLNGSNLPVVAKQYVVSDVLGLLTNLVPSVIESEKQALKEGDKDEQNIH